MPTRLADASQQAAANGVVDRLDAAAGTLKIYSGAQPSDADTDPTGLLVTVTLPAPAYGSASASGTAALLGVPLSGTASGTGTAACFSVETSAGANVFQGSCGMSGSSADLILDNTSIAAGQTVNISSLDYTHPAS